MRHALASTLSLLSVLLAGLLAGLQWGTGMAQYTALQLPGPVWLLRHQAEDALFRQVMPGYMWLVLLSLAGLPTFGYIFEAHALFEGGKKLEDTLVYNSDKSASMVLPQYSIARPGVQLHGLMQFKRVSADSVFTGRYLLFHENSVLAHKDKSLYLYQFHGWKGYQAFTGAYQIDDLNHWSITATYSNGFAPPKFNRTNSTQIGVLIKY